jgi:hypothetical protein
VDSRIVTDEQQLLAELARTGSENRQEASVVVSPGAGGTAWAVKVKSLVMRNTYEVRTVIVGEPGSIPVEIGDPMEATNLAESFLSQGTLAAGTYAVMHRVGERNVFYAVP